MNAKQWHDAVAARDKCCAAEQHDPSCRLAGEHAHHVVYRSHCTKEALWLLDNGVWLSLLCHDLAHRTRNANISDKRKRVAVDAVNAVVPPYLRRPYFEPKAA